MAKLRLGSKAIPFALPGTDEEEYSLADFADKPVIVIIFSDTDCSYVQTWEDRLVAIQADYAGQGVQLVAINTNLAGLAPEASLVAMQARAAEKGFNFPYLYDEAGEFARFYGIEWVPEVFVFDQRRVLRYHGAIDDNAGRGVAGTRPYLRDALDAVLAGQTPALAETPLLGCAVTWK